MTIAYRTGWTNTTPADPLDITIVAAAGDFLAAYAVNDDGRTGVTWTAGWTEQAEIATPTFDGQVLGVATKVSAGSEITVQADYDFSTAIGGCVAFTGVDATTPLDVTVVTNLNDTGVASPHTLAASITPTTNGCQIVAIMGSDVGSSVDTVFSFATTAGTTGAWTVHQDLNNGFRNVAIASCNQTTAGAITVTGTGTGGTAARAITLLALRPSGGGGGGGDPAATTVGRRIYVMP